VRPAREDEQRKLVEAEARERAAREANYRREFEERLRVEQMAAQERIEEERKLQEAARQEVARQDALRQESQRQLMTEQKRQEELRQQQEAQKRFAALQLKQEEQTRQEALRQQEEQKRLAALQQQQQQQDEQKRQEAALRKQVDLERTRIAENCRREEAKLAELRAGGAKAREQLVKFESEVDCKSLRPMVTATIAALPADAPVSNVPPAVMAPPSAALAAPLRARANQTDQIRQAQIELKRLGCLRGNPDGELNRKTQDAVKTFWRSAHKPVVDVVITDDLIADLQKQDDDICAPPRKPAPPVATIRPRPPAAPSLSGEPPSATAGATPPSSGARPIGAGF
jgi:hypothetical protein